MKAARYYKGDADRLSNFTAAQHEEFGTRFQRVSRAGEAAGS